MRDYFLSLLWVERFALGFCLLGVFFFPVSTALAQFLLLSVVLSFFLVKQRIALLWQVGATRVALALFFLALVGVFFHIFYFSTPLIAFNAVQRFIYKLLVFCMLIFLFNDKRARYYAFVSFMAGMSIFYLSQLFQAWLPVRSVAVMSMSMLTALTSYFALYFIFQKKHLLLNSLVLLLGLLYLFHLNHERLGELVLAVLFILMAWQRFRWKGLWVLPMLLIIGFGLYHYNTMVRFKWRNAVTHAWRYQETGPVKLQKNSTGLRLDLITHIYHVSKRSPWFGFGTGSFTQAYDLLPDSVSGPHRDGFYVTVVADWGYIGLALWLLWSVVCWCSACSLPKCEAQLFRAAIIAIFLANLTSPGYWEHFSGLSFSLAAAVLLGAHPRFQRNALKTNE